MVLQAAVTAANGQNSNPIDKMSNDIVKRHAQVVHGNPPSKSNCYRVVTINGHGAMAKQKMLKKWEQSFFMQMGVYRGAMIRKYFILEIDVYFTSQRSDLDNALKAVLDCLQACKAIENDRWCVEIRARKFVDKYDPRVEFTITPIEGIETRPMEGSEDG